MATITKKPATKRKAARRTTRGDKPAQDTSIDDVLAPKIVMRRLSEIQFYEGNARQHSEEQVERIAESIKRYGFTNPILLDINDVAIAGHGRCMGAHKLQMEWVPTIKLDHLTEDEARRYRLVDNRLQELSDWDPGILKAELNSLMLAEETFSPADLSFDDKFLANIGVIATDRKQTDKRGEQVEEHLIVIVCDSEEQQESLHAELTDRGLNIKLMG